MTSTQSNSTAEPQITWGLFQDKIPFVKVGSGPKTLVYLRGATDLFLSVITDPLGNGKSKRKLITPEHTLYILGYPRDLPPNTTVEQLADTFAEVIKNHIGKATIIGSSLGGLVAIILTAKHPALVHKLILAFSACQFSASFVERTKEWFKIAETGKIWKVLLKMNDFINGFFFRNLMKLTTLLLWPKAKKQVNPISTAFYPLKDAVMRNGELKKFLPLIQAETVILGGTKDIAFSTEIYKETTELIPHAKLVLIPGAGHMMADEHPKAYRTEFQKLI